MDIQATPVYEKMQDKFQSWIKILVSRWSTSSSKTRTTLQHLLVWLVSGTFCGHELNRWVAHICRKFKASLTTSVQRDFEHIMYEDWFYVHIKVNKSLRQYSVMDSEWKPLRMVEFIGADDPQKLRWPRRDILYCNEGNELTFKWERFQLIKRTRRFAIVDFNPSDADVWINTELEQKRMHIKWDVWLLVSTYKDNPFLAQDEVDEIEYIKEEDPEMWKVYWLGEYGKVEGLVFKDCEIIPDIPNGAKKLGYWLDFWFTNDPTSLTGLYMQDGAIIYDEEIYEHRLTNQDIDQRMLDLWLLKGNDEIIADSAEPKSIEELYRLGRNIKWAKKWSDSIMYGINTMKKYPIKITARSINAIKESKKYMWATDKNGNSLNKPIDKHNHFRDWARYITMHKLWVPKATILVG